MNPEEILTFWFGAEGDDALVAQERAGLWWGKSSHTDEEIRARFAELVTQANRGELVQWERTPRGLLALILLTDQFLRCIHRDTPNAFAYDPKALSWCVTGLERGFDRSLRPIERVFFYLPLEHSESLEHQQRSVQLFQQLLDEVRKRRQSEPVAAQFIAPFQEFFDFAARHRDIIARFGRFPHRNRILGRESTPEETAFLAEPGSSF